MVYAMPWRDFLSYVQWEANFYDSCLREPRKPETYKLRRTSAGHNGHPTTCYVTITLTHPIGGVPPYTAEDRKDLSPNARLQSSDTEPDTQ